ncbi:hypothetical protein Tco_0948933, partial [Tanacetum coccineum]
MAYTSGSDTVVNLEDVAYQLGLESIEAQLIVHQKNKAVYEEKIAVLEFEVKDKGYGDQLNENDSSGSELFNIVFDSRLSNGDDNQTNDRFKKYNEYHVFPPPLTGNYMPPLADLSFVGLDDSIYRPTIYKTSASLVELSLKIRFAMSSNNASSTVTYTSVSSDSNGPSSWGIPLENADKRAGTPTVTCLSSDSNGPSSWGIPLENAGEIPDMDPYEEVAQQGQAHPLSPAYVHDPMELDEHVPLYAPEPEHPEHHIPSDNDSQAEDQPYAEDVSPTAESPRYIADSDPIEDDTDTDSIDYLDEPRTNDEDEDEDPEEDPSKEHEPEDEGAKEDESSEDSDKTEP